MHMNEENNWNNNVKNKKKKSSETNCAHPVQFFISFLRLIASQWLILFYISPLETFLRFFSEITINPFGGKLMFWGFRKIGNGSSEDEKF